ncbi:hypothetical protein CYLTODRAFT_414144 [Cylindrobasidium torrendii FP15055 ss-10]|uniref:Uncharacterized protein n=1 Tax=Cylindrobasidium torrendii FP15055 ss-10 TaxID=1314674 RepID=A0A0D7B183_9AGAR|nr:hypothetical protein CYLTODRAFT_414144 [Cylindrobasidium torrendii FP15055 ss-10]
MRRYLINSLLMGLRSNSGMGRPKKYHSEEERRLARKQWDASYYRRNQDKIKEKMHLSYKAARAQYEREHDLPPKPEPLNFVQHYPRKRPTRLEKELKNLKEQHNLWLSAVNSSPRDFLESTYRRIVDSETQASGEKKTSTPPTIP